MQILGVPHLTEKGALYANFWRKKMENEHAIVGKSAVAKSTSRASHLSWDAAIA